MSELLDKIAAEHLRPGIEGCSCGGMRLGESYPRHVAEVTEQAVRAQIVTDIHRRKRDLAKRYAGTARAMLEGGMEEAIWIASGSADQ